MRSSNDYCHADEHPSFVSLHVLDCYIFSDAIDIHGERLLLSSPIPVVGETRALLRCLLLPERVFLLISANILIFIYVYICAHIFIHIVS